MRFLSSILLLLISLGSAMAQVPMTGAGLPKPAAAAGYQGPGDVTGFSTGVIAWWGLRGFKTTTSGPIFNVCDEATGLVCADATWSNAGGGALTLPTIGGFACDNSTHKCEVAILYDQSGANSCSGACDGSNAHGGRPVLVINCIGTLPCMDAIGSSLLRSANLAASTSQPYTISVIAERTSGGQSSIIIGGSNLSEAIFNSAADSVGMYAFGSIPSVTALDNVVHTLQVLFNNTSSVIYVDATNNSVSVGTTNNLGNGAPFEFPSTASGALTGRVFEGGYWAGDKTSNFSDMHTNQCTYWGTVC